MPLPNGNVKKLRASYYLMGAMLGRFKKAVIGLPGGCFLGPRPIDQHIKGFEALGAKVTNEHGAIYLRADELIGAKIYLRCGKCRRNNQYYARSCTGKRENGH